MRKILPLAAILWMLYRCLPAQAIVVRGELRPATPVAGTFFLDTLKHQAEYFGQGGWTRIGEVRALEACEDLVVVQAFSHHDIRPMGDDFGQPQHEIWSASFGNLYSNVSESRCDGRLLLCHRFGKAFILDARPNVPINNRYLTSSFPAYFGTVLPDTVQGQRAYSVPGYAPQFIYHSTPGQLHNWGTLSTNGEWLIDPIYDEKFEFEGGRAQVKRYGGKLSIDESGNVIEEGKE